MITREIGKLLISRRDFLKGGLAAGVLLAAGVPVVKIKGVLPQQLAAAKVTLSQICTGCFAFCHLVAVKRNGKMYLLTNPEYPQPGLCARAASIIQMWNHPLRLKKPLKRVGARGEGKFVEVGWDSALDEIATKLKGIVEKFGPESIAFTRHGHSWEVPFITSLLGTPNHINHEGTCHNSSTAARKFILGASGPPTVDPDYENVRYLLLVGRVMNAAMSHVRRLAEARKRGVKIVVVDPRAPNIAFSGVEWVPILPGTDAAFILSLIHVIISEGLYDEAFLKKYTNVPFLIKPDGTPATEKDLGREIAKFIVYDVVAKDFIAFDKAKDPALDWEGEIQTPLGPLKVETAFKLLTKRALKYKPEEAEKITGVPADTIRRIAREFATAIGVAEDGWFAAKNGNDLYAYMARLTLNALVGNIDKKGGLCFPESAKFPKTVKVHPDKIETLIGVSLPPIKAKRVDKLKYPEAVSSFDALLDTILTEKPYPIKALFIAATAPFTRDVNTEKIKKAFEKLELIVSVDVLPQDHIDWSDYTLPDLMILEREVLWAHKWTLLATISSAYKFIDPPPGVEARKAFWALMEIIRRAFPDKAALVGYTEKYRDYRAFEEYEAKFREVALEKLAKTWKISVDEIKKSLKERGFYVLKKKRYGVHPYKVALKTPTGLVEIYALEALKRGLDPLPVQIAPLYTLPRAPNEFYLVNGKDQNISTQFAFTKNAKWLVDRRVWMNPQDAERLGIKDGDLIELEGIDNGFKAKTKVWVTNRVRSGVLWTYAMAGGRVSRLINEEYNFLKEGVNPHWFTTGKIEPVVGSGTTNSSVRVKKL